jgi:hypothetical protein
MLSYSEFAFSLLINRNFSQTSAMFFTNKPLFFLSNKGNKGNKGIHLEPLFFIKQGEQGEQGEQGDTS